ncbi:hypothetical protein SBA2_670101 [Acidobacteriia bacterium SbA2]|nr:hypothetical protein SBA2_670101 [Acidobacteriia bacterium SbA2]
MNSAHSVLSCQIIPGGRNKVYTDFGGFFRTWLTVQAVSRNTWKAPRRATTAVHRSCQVRLLRGRVPAPLTPSLWPLVSLPARPP